MSRNPITGPDGVLYNSETELCRKYGVNLLTFRSRRAAGKSLSDSLNCRLETSVTAPNGVSYRSAMQMADAYGIDYMVYLGRIYRGWSVSEALGVETHDYYAARARVRSTPLDVPGDKIHSSVEEACKAYGIKRGTYCSRIRLGWTVREALELDSHDYSDWSGRDPEQVILAPNGKYYKTAKELCTDYEIDPCVYRARISALGWSVSEALNQSGRGLESLISANLSINDKVNIEKRIASVGAISLYAVILPNDKRSVMTADQIKAYPVGWKTIEEGI